MTLTGPGQNASKLDTGDHYRDIAAAFPRAGVVPVRAVRLELLSELHRYYTGYLGGAESFRLTPRLNGDPRLVHLEKTWLDWEDAQVDTRRLPSSAAEFSEWFQQLSARHVQPDFCRYVAEDASLSEIALFFLAEELVDSRFDDLVALVQIGAGDVSKLVMAENYWDEMGEGTLDRMHTRLFEHSARYMREQLTAREGGVADLHCAEIYENACLVLMYGIHRHLAPRAIGALGLMEHSAPTRFQAMVDGCTRLGVPEDVIDYQRIHIHVDADHGSEWLDYVMQPLVDRSPELLHEISMGILTRERIAEAYYQQVWEQMKGLQ